MSSPAPKPPIGFDSLKPYAIGPKLKAFRTEKGLTLSHLSTETDLSTALLSKLEGERMIPTLPTLAKISHAFGVDLSYFFSPVTHHSLAITRSKHIADPRRHQSTARHTPLHRATPESRQFSKIVDIPAGVSFDVGGPASRTELTAYILGGPLNFTAAGVVEVLRTGDCIVIDTNGPAVLTALQTSCRVLTVFARTHPE